MATLGVTGFDGSIEYKYSSSQSHDYTDGQAGGGGGYNVDGFYYGLFSDLLENGGTRG